MEEGATEEFDLDDDDYGRGVFGDEEQGEEEEHFSKIGSSSDGPEQLRRYHEYLALIKEIACQNRVVERLKNDIAEMCAKPCKTRCELKEIQERRQNMEQENLKLCCLITKAMDLQNFGSRRRYRDIPIATTFEEDNMAPYVDCVPQPDLDLDDGDSNEPPCPCSQSNESEAVCESSEDSLEQEKLRCLCKKLKSMKICCPADKELVKQVAAVLCKSTKKKPKDVCPPPPKPCKPDPCRTCPVHNKPQRQQPRPCPDDEEDQEQAKIDKLKAKLCCMQKTIDKLKEEIKKREPDEDVCGGQEKEKKKPKEKECKHEEAEDALCSSKRPTKSDQLHKLKENYVHLLSEFCKKDAQIKDLEKRLKGTCGGCGNMGKGDEQDNAMECELQLLRTRVNELKEEQIEFKCLMKEQSQQLEDYRTKYLTAQQKVEEQSATLEKLNLNNKRIEKQINNEVKEIRAKFQEKLNELMHFPKLLENEQLKLAQCCKEKEDLQNKLVVVCKELQTLKDQKPQQLEDCRPQLLKCQTELAQLKKQYEEVERQRDMYCEEMTNIKDDLDTLRSESAKIISRTKERAELLRHKLQDRIDQLERELAQCRASACLHISDREAVIREMQGQLNSLSYSFDAAQKQIKTLRNHIAYVSNENCFPVKC